jgi:tripartite-type tricarboxylate transporter receptor subunit TctC
MPASNARRMDRRTANRFLLGLAASTAASGIHSQESYPDRPIRFVVPQPAGGTGDVVSRMVGERLAARLGKPVVIENRPGAGGTLGASNVAKSPPDGYSLVLASPSFSTFSTLYTGISFNPATDFAPVGMMGIVPVVLLVRADSPYKTLADFIDYAKANPGKTAYSSAGQGALSHLLGAWFKSEAGLDILHVPYAGTAPALTALIGGQVDINFDAMAGAQLLKAGKVRALATTDVKRSPLLPDVPTMSELGIPVRGSVWLGILAAAGTPRPIAARLNRELELVLREPGLRTQLLTHGVQPEAMSIDEFSRFYDAETRTWTKLVRDNGIKIE